VVIFLNKLTLLGSAEQFERHFRPVADFMLAQPGIVRFVLARSQKDASVYFMVAEWTDAGSFEQATQQVEFRSRYAELKPFIKGDPHLTEVRMTGSPQEA